MGRLTNEQIEFIKNNVGTLTNQEIANKLIKQEPQIKKLIEQYKQVDIDESFLEELHDDEW